MDFEYEKDELLACREKSIKKILTQYGLKSISNDADIENILDYQNRIKRSNLLVCPIDVHCLISKHLSLPDVYRFTQVNKKLRAHRLSPTYSNYIITHFLTHVKERKPKTEKLFVEISKILSDLYYSYKQGYEIYFFNNIINIETYRLSETNHIDMFYRGIYKCMHQSPLLDMVYNFDSFIQLKDICVAKDLEGDDNDSEDEEDYLYPKWMSSYKTYYHTIYTFSCKKNDNNALRYIINNPSFELHRYHILYNLINSGNVEIIRELNPHETELQSYTLDLFNRYEDGESDEDSEDKKENDSQDKDKKGSEDKQKNNRLDLIKYFIEREININKKYITYRDFNILKYLHNNEIIDLEDNKYVPLILEKGNSDVLFNVLRKYHGIKVSDLENKKLLKYFDEMNKTTKMSIIKYYLKRDLLAGFRYLLPEKLTETDSKKLANMALDYWSINCLEYLMSTHDIDIEQRKKHINFNIKKVITLDSLKYVLGKKIIKKVETSNLTLIMKKVVSQEENSLECSKYIIEYSSFNVKDITNIIYTAVQHRNKEVLLYLFSEYGCLPSEWRFYPFLMSLDKKSINKAILEKTKYNKVNSKKYCYCGEEIQKKLIEFRLKHTEDETASVKKFLLYIAGYHSQKLIHYLKQQYQIK